MLEELCKKDTQWRKIALKICKDELLADDLVQEAYLKAYNINKQINDFYFILIIKNTFLDYLRQKKTVSIENFYNFTTPEKFELDDNQLKVVKECYWVAKDLLLMSEDKSIRKIAQELNVNYRFIYRVIEKEKKKWQELNQKA